MAEHSPSELKGECLLALAQKLNSLSIVELGRFIGVLADSPLDCEAGQAVTAQIEKEVTSRIQKETLKEFTYQEMGNLYYFVGKAQSKGALGDWLGEALEEGALDIPKQVFPRVFFTALLLDHLGLAFKMLPFLL